MGQQKEGGPEHRRSNGKMVVEMAGPCTKFRPRLTVLVTAGFPKTIVSGLVVMGKIQIVLNEWGAGIRVIANSVPPHPRVQQWNGNQEYAEQDPFESALRSSKSGCTQCGD